MTNRILPMLSVAAAYSSAPGRHNQSYKRPRSNLSAIETDLAWIKRVLALLGAISLLL